MNDTHNLLEFFGFPTSNPYETVVATVPVNLTCRDSIIPDNPYQDWSLPTVICPTETGRKTRLSDDGNLSIIFLKKIY